MYSEECFNFCSSPEKNEIIDMVYNEKTGAWEADKNQKVNNLKNCKSKTKRQTTVTLTMTNITENTWSFVV